MTQNCLVPHEEKKFSTQKGATYIPFPTIHSHEVGENMLNMLNMLKSSLKRLYIIYIKFVKWVPFSPTKVTVNLRGRECEFYYQPIHLQELLVVVEDNMDR